MTTRLTFSRTRPIAGDRLLTVLQEELGRPGWWGVIGLDCTGPEAQELSRQIAATPRHRRLFEPGEMAELAPRLGQVIEGTLIGFDDADAASEFLVTDVEPESLVGRARVVAAVHDGEILDLLLPAGRDSRGLVDRLRRELGSTPTRVDVRSAGREPGPPEELAELDVVQVAQNLPEHGLVAGQVGTIVIVHAVPDEAFEVEFVNPDGSTRSVRTLRREQLRRR